MSSTAYLVLRSVPASVWAQPITSNPIKAGRLKSCEIHLAHDTVSREHAEFRLDGIRLLLRDCGSSNGSYVNDKKVTETTFAVGDVIRLGHVVLDVVHESAVKEGTAVLEHRPTKVPNDDADGVSHEAAVERLSETQLRVLRCLLTGESEKVIAADLHVSPHTVHSHVQAIYRELSVKSRAELMSLFIDRAVIDPKA